MSLPGIRSLPSRFQLVLLSLQQCVSLPFSDALTEEQIQSACDEHGVSQDGEQEDDDEQQIFTPAITLWGFLSQVIHKQENRSCLAAVARISVLLVALGREPCAQNSGPYCRARRRLPLVVVERLTLEAAATCEAQIPDQWLWKGRHVKVGDGTSVTMPDTAKNQAAFPQQTCQKEGLGFPIARLMVLLSLATAMVQGMAMGPFAGKETGELALLRQLLDQFDAGDVFLADKLYCSYFMIALLLVQKVDVVVLLHQARKVDIRRGRRLGKNDHLITWERPDRPSWMDQETYERMPRSLTLRLVHVNINQPGFRTKSLDIITTLTDAQAYSPDELAELYHRRWLVELDIRAIKVTMGMDQLRCQSPEMVRKEIWTCLLAYNMIRQKLLQAALKKGVSPREMSFTNAMQLLAAAWMVMPLVEGPIQKLLLSAGLEGMSDQIVGKRPGRVEPRAVKRRPKPFRLLTMLREKARELLLSGIDPYKKQK